MPRPVPSAPVPPAKVAYRGQVARLSPLLRGDLLPPSGPAPHSTVRQGLNFATQDYLGLSAHPLVRAATLPVPGDSPQDSLAVPLIESRLASALKLPGAVSFASGSDAIRQTLPVLLTPEDHVLVDHSAPPAMFSALSAAGSTVLRFPATSLDAVERRLFRLSRLPRRGRLVIAVPAVSAHGSRIADLAELSSLAQAHGALLVVDASHDFGAIGQDGGGIMEVRGCLGRADIVLGSLAKCFGAAGGFAAFRDPDLEAAVRQMARPLSPTSARTILAATAIAFSAEGNRRRHLLHGISLRLRNHLMADGAPVIGKASPLVPVLLPAGSALHRAAMLESAGPRVTLLQAPCVPRHAPRWRIELSALHSPADIDDLAELVRDVTRAFDRAPLRLRAAV